MKLTTLCTVIIFIELSQQCVIGRRLNFTKFPANQFGTEYDWGIPHYNSPSIIVRDISYLPEDDYTNDNNEFQIIDGIENKSPQQQLERADRNLRPEYRNLCEIRTRLVQLSDSEYEYQPPHYHEIYCKSYSLLDQTVFNSVKPSRQLCAHPGFHCVQRSRTVSFVRRRWSDECWEPYTKEIASGCDCMWPVSTLGDITAHY